MLVKGIQVPEQNMLSYEMECSDITWSLHGYEYSSPYCGLFEMSVLADNVANAWSYVYSGTSLNSNKIPIKSVGKVNFSVSQSYFK